MNSYSNLQLMETYIATGYSTNADGRLQFVNEPGDAYAPPRFVMGRTSEGNLWRFRYDLPIDLIRELEHLCQAEPVSIEYEGQPHGAEAIRAVLQAYKPIEVEERGPVYLIPDGIPVPNNVVSISDANVHVLKKGFPWRGPLPTTFEIGPFTGTIIEGFAVSLCYCARLATQAASAGVDTLEQFRGHGYAAGAVAGWAAEVRRRGLLPMYGTFWENHASRRVIQKLGMLHFGEKWCIT
jgi:hypothetical protein